MEMPGDRNSIAEATRALERWGRERGWQGADPYDGLNSSRFSSVLRHTPTGRRILIQTVKRSPVDLRPILRVPLGVSAVSLALVASAYARNGILDPEVADQRLRDVLGAVWRERSRAFDEPCWGYHFDVQTRVFFYPRGSPNTIATAFAGHAFLDAYERTSERLWLDTARGAGEFFLRHVPATETPEGLFFGYLAGDRTPIHNANMLVCSLLARLSRYPTGSQLKQTAAGVAYTLAHQRTDGSWPYGERPDLAWTDNFHTGYVLEALMRCRAAGTTAERLDAALEHGLGFYRRHLFRADGAPKYLGSSLYPIDMQCAAQGIVTFALAARLDSAHAEMAWRVARFALANMRRPDGAFIFQRRRMWSNRTPHIRWCQAPMLLALMHLLALPDP